MLIEFSVSNFRSIKEMQTLSFLATSMNEHEDTNTFMANDKTRLLKSVGIYGANGSGKSNVVKALWFMINYIKATSEEKRKFGEHIQPFKLNTATRDEGSFFQIIFLIDKKTYRYGFVYNKGKITAEWLFGPAQKNEVEYFTRENNEFNINKERFKEGIGLENKTREDNLFLNVVYEFNGEVSSIISNFYQNILIHIGNDNITDNYPYLSIYDSLKSMTITPEMLDFVKIADVDIVNLRNNKIINSALHLEKEIGINVSNLIKEHESEYNKRKNITNFHINNNENKIISQRKLFDENLKEVGVLEMDFEEEASEGTKKMLNYAQVVLKSIKSGRVLVIDEFEARFHPRISRSIIKLFNSINNNSGQLCFVTHNTNLLDNKLLRRDQIYFTEKNTRGETSLYSLSEIKGVRNDASFENDYIKGKYGAIPFIEQSNSVFE